MKKMKTNSFDLAVVDPPYNISKFTGTELGKGGGVLDKRPINKFDTNWDEEELSEEYFEQLFRVSKNQIVWGGNYYNLPPWRCVLVWDKMQPFKNFSAVEIAWTSFSDPAKLFKFDNRYGGKIHATQKPVKLYQWIFKEFAKKGDKILDTHLGSASSAIAADLHELEFTGFEISPKYFKLAEERIKFYKNQIKLKYDKNKSSRRG